MGLKSEQGLSPPPWPSHFNHWSKLDTRIK